LANKSAIKALLINKVGDSCLIIGISICFFFFKTLDFYSLFILTPFHINMYINIINIRFNLLNLIGFFILIGCMAKSAQIGLHT